MRYGYMTGGGYGGMIVMLLVLLAALVLLYWLLRSGRRPETNPRHDLIIEILKHRYVTNEISADQYLDMKKIIESSKDFSSEILALKEQFARGELNAEEYWQKQSSLKNDELHRNPT